MKIKNKAPSGCSQLVNESKVLQKEVKDLKAKNNQLLARLEKLENIALKFQSSSEMISVATKD